MYAKRVPTPAAISALAIARQMLPKVVDLLLILTTECQRNSLIEGEGVWYMGIHRYHFCASDSELGVADLRPAWTKGAWNDHSSLEVRKYILIEA